MYYLSGATFRLVGERFDPQRFAHVDGIEVGKVNSTNLLGRTALRSFCLLNAPHHGQKKVDFENMLAYFASRELDFVDAGLSPHIEISNLLVSIMVHPLIGESFQFPSTFFTVLRTIHSTLSIHFTNDDPKEPVEGPLESVFSHKYCVILENANKEPEEADMLLKEFLRKTEVKGQTVPIILKLPSLKARSNQTARFNLSHECIETLASRKLSLKLDVVGSAMGKSMIAKAKRALRKALIQETSSSDPPI